MLLDPAEPPLATASPFCSERCCLTKHRVGQPVFYRSETEERSEKCDYNDICERIIIDIHLCADKHAFALASNARSLLRLVPSDNNVVKGDGIHAPASQYIGASIHLFFVFFVRHGSRRYTAATLGRQGESTPDVS